MKSDQRAINTGNFIVEIEMYGKMSGLMTTTPNLGALSDGEEVFWGRHRPLKGLIIWRVCKAIKTSVMGKVGFI